MSVPKLHNLSVEDTDMNRSETLPEKMMGPPLNLEMEAVLHGSNEKVNVKNEISGLNGNSLVPDVNDTDKNQSPTVSAKSCATVNVNADCDDEITNEFPTDPDGHLENLMTVSQLHVATETSRTECQGNCNVSTSPQFGMTVSQLFVATRISENQYNEHEPCKSLCVIIDEDTSKVNGEHAAIGNASETNPCNSDDKESRSEKNTSHYSNDNDDIESVTISTVGHDSSDIDIEKGVTAVSKLPQAVDAPDINSPACSGHTNKPDEKGLHEPISCENRAHKLQDYDESNQLDIGRKSDSNSSATSVASSLNQHVLTHGESSCLDTESQVDTNTNSCSEESLTCKNMLCLSSNQTPCLLRQTKLCPDLTDVGLLNTIRAIGDQHNESHVITDLSQLCQQDKDHKCTQSQAFNPGSKGFLNTTHPTQERNVLNEETYPDLFTTKADCTNEEHYSEKRDQTVIIDNLPRGISGNAINKLGDQSGDKFSNLPKDFDGVGFETLSRSKKKNHAKFLRLYDQIDIEDSGATESKSLQSSKSTALTNEEQCESQVEEKQNGLSRNGSLSSVRLRRQKSSPDPGRKPLNGSPLMRVRGIIIDDCSSNDSDSPRCSEDSDDEDEDAGIYAESYRMSRWLYLGENDLTVSGSDLGNLGISRSGSSSPSMAGTTSSGTCDSLSDLLDEGHDLVTLEFQEGQLKDGMEYCSQDVRKQGHRRSESISTTASEGEYRRKYKTKTKRMVQRKSSMQLYHRISEKYLDEGHLVTIEKLDEDASFGFHIKDSQPVVVSTVEEGSPAQRGGLQVGDVVVAVNEVNVLEATHQEVVKLMASDTDRVTLRVVADRLPGDAPLCCGYLTKQGGSGILKNWRRRWFVLKQDHCLYYYKTEEDKDPLGAILLSNYTITKAPEVNRKFVFKASKYGQRTYYFQAESEEEMTGWASAMASAADVSNKTDTWLDVSSHNVGLPALAIKQPDCHGYLTKMGNRRKNWKRRYCVLKDACLYYYLDVNSSTAQGVAHLHGYRVEGSLPFNKKFGFMVVPPDANLRTFYFSADNDTDKKRWMDALQKSIGRWVRAEEQ